MSGPFFDPINYLTDKEYLAVNVWISQEDHFPEYRRSVTELAQYSAHANVMYNKRVEVKETLGESSSVWLINDGKYLKVLNRAVRNLMECVDDLQETSWMAQPPLTRELFHHANNLFAFLRESKRVVADFIEKLLVRESLEFALVFPNHGISVELRGTMYERCYIINEELDQLMQHLWFSV